MLQSCACLVRPEGHPGSFVGGDLRKRLKKKKERQGESAGRTRSRSWLRGIALPKRGPVKDRRVLYLISQITGDFFIPTRLRQAT
ncbi:hypothetical protein C6382_22795 [Pseudomonas sp. BBP2017]|nr:hypothetical protein C6382_22795 [Pseudomonas sp. BBP2017]